MRMTYSKRKRHGICGAGGVVLFRQRLRKNRRFDRLRVRVRVCVFSRVCMCVCVSVCVRLRVLYTHTRCMRLDVFVCVRVCVDVRPSRRENARLSLAGPERSGPAGRSVVIITAFFLFSSQTARQLVFLLFIFLRFFFIFVSCYVCSITAGICRSAWPYACVAACTYYPVTYTACN